MSFTNEKPLQVAIYARYSTDRQDSRSIDDQMRRCRAYAMSHGQRIVAEYYDAAVSGAHIDRADMQRMLAAARAKGGSPFAAVLVDDLSRLSRDLGNTWQIVFHDLASENVRVIDITTGLSSDAVGARLTFGAMALVNDTFLQLVRTETHRGLEGRALGGFSTGGRCYGYSTVEEPNPPDREHPRKRTVIVEEEAAVVVRIFKEFVGGKGPKKIAIALNEEGIPAPYDGRGNKCVRGWADTTIRAMLKNRRYLGLLTWNQSKWIRTPGSKGRRRMMRPKSEWITKECPEIAIVSEEAWQKAQSRFRRTATESKGRPLGTGKRASLVAGLMRCGVCGSRITVVGTRTKNGVSYARFGCSAHHSKGETVCNNRGSVSERSGATALVRAVQEKLARPEVVERFVSAFCQRVERLRKETGGERDDIERRIVGCERRIGNLTESLAKLGWSDSLAAKLREEELQLAQLKTLHCAQLVAPDRALPERAVIQDYLTNLFMVLEADPERGREILSKYVSPTVVFLGSAT